MSIGSLFSGIGLLDLGLERAGWGTPSWQVEIDDYCRAVLTRHWPGAARYSDVREVDAATLPPVDVVCGGFPCQPVSVAGRRKAQEDPRWLWPEFARVLAAVRPPIAIIENVPGLRTAGMRDVLADLADLGFDAEWAVHSAAEVGAPHLRRRIWIVATDPDRIVVRHEPGWLGRALDATIAPIPGDHAARGGDGANATGEQLARREPPSHGRGHGVPARDPRRPSHGAYTDGLRRLESSFRLAEERGWSRRVGWSVYQDPRVDDGLPGRVERRRRALGNGVVVQAAEAVGRAAREAVVLR